MNTSLSFIIRDAIEEDIALSLQLDHSFGTDYVWRISIHPDNHGRSVRFQRERMPRTLETLHRVDETHLTLCLLPYVCYLVAVNKEMPSEMLGYLTMRTDPIYKTAYLQDIVVDRSFRGLGIGSRLLKIALNWAVEHGMNQLIAEVSNKNDPAIEFLQNRGFAFCGFNDQYFHNHDIALFLGQSIR